MLNLCAFLSINSTVDDVVKPTTKMASILRSSTLSTKSPSLLSAASSSVDSRFSLPQNVCNCGCPVLICATHNVPLCVKCIQSGHSHTCRLISFELWNHERKLIFCALKELAPYIVTMIVEPGFSARLDERRRTIEAQVNPSNIERADSALFRAFQLRKIAWNLSMLKNTLDEPTFQEWQNCLYGRENTWKFFHTCVDAFIQISYCIDDKEFGDFLNRITDLTSATFSDFHNSMMALELTPGQWVKFSGYAKRNFISSVQNSFREIDKITHLDQEQLRKLNSDLVSTVIRLKTMSTGSSSTATEGANRSVLENSRIFMMEDGKEETFISIHPQEVNYINKLWKPLLGDPDQHPLDRLQPNLDLSVLGSIIQIAGFYLCKGPREAVEIMDHSQELANQSKLWRVLRGFLHLLNKNYENANELLSDFKENVVRSFLLSIKSTATPVCRDAKRDPFATKGNFAHFMNQTVQYSKRKNNDTHPLYQLGALICSSVLWRLEGFRLLKLLGESLKERNNELGSYITGIAELEIGSYSGAKREFVTVKTLDPFLSNLMDFYIGVCNQKQDNFPDAVVHYKAFGLSQSYHHHCTYPHIDLDVLLRFCREYSIGSKDDGDGWALGGVYLNLQGKWNEAQNYFKNALEKEKDNPLALVGKGIALINQDSRDISKANSAFDRAKDICQASSSISTLATFQQGCISLQNRMYQETALDYFQKVVGEDPRNSCAHFHHGLALQKRQRHSKAIQSFERCLKIDPGFCNAIYGIGEKVFGSSQWSRSDFTSRRKILHG